ncbi:hypothetical protein HPP92_002606 [Vanilla planifolia]|uniref:Uncharacterized protein n=1 Tax=Vanilla planifolia TaxID=51239 RepID=A0A835RSV5_VANPL|nr:hypothetical protein HPP92_002606 [Vanilla planifolia]
MAETMGFWLSDGNGFCSLQGLRHGKSLIMCGGWILVEGFEVKVVTAKSHSMMDFWEVVHCETIPGYMRAPSFEILGILRKHAEGAAESTAKSITMTFTEGNMDADIIALLRILMLINAWPLVPPGFATVQLEKNHSVRSVSVDKNSVLPSKEFESVIACNNFSLNATALQEVHKVQEAGIQMKLFLKRWKDVTLSLLYACLLSPISMKEYFALGCHSSHFSVEKKAIEEKSSRDLLQLIVSDDNLNSQVCISSEDEVAKQMNAAQHSEDFVTPHISTGVPSDSHRSDDKQNLSCVLTCEDLEQSILAVVKESSSGIHSMQEPKTLFDGKFKNIKIMWMIMHPSIFFLYYRGCQLEGDSLVSWARCC